jgi:RNA polymerase sigma-70 factor, ECF subfamily
MEIERKEKKDLASRCDFEQGQGERTHRTNGKEDEQALVELLRDGDSDGMKGIMLKYHGRLFSVANAICRNHADTEEVLQDVYWKAWEKIDRFEERSTLGTWLHRITVNTALMKVRSHRHHSRTVSMEDAGEFSHEDLILIRSGAWARSPEDILAGKEIFERLSASVENLPPLYQSTFLLRDVLEFSIQETGEMIRTTAAAVKSRLHRGRTLIRKDCGTTLTAN